MNRLSPPPLTPRMTTLRVNDTRSRRLSVSMYGRVSNSYPRCREVSLKNFEGDAPYQRYYNSAYQRYSESATLRFDDSGESVFDYEYLHKFGSKIKKGCSRCVRVVEPIYIKTFKNPSRSYYVPFKEKNHKILSVIEAATKPFNDNTKSSPRFLQ